MSNFRQWVLGCLLVFLTACGSSTPEEQYASAVSELCEPFGMEAQGVCKRMIYASGVSLEVLLHRLNPDKPAANPDAGEGAKAKKEEGKVGKKDAKMEKAKGNKVEISLQELDREIADNAGLMGSMDGILGDTIVDENMMGGIGGALGAKGYQMGSGGLGSRGSGLGGGGSSGFGTGGGNFGPRGEGGIGRIGGDPIIYGALDKSLIDRVIKRNMNQIKYCYSRQLNANPALNGKIVVKFVISRDGSVSQAKTHSSTMTGGGAVQSCINQRFLRFQFPEPKGGGIVIVKYPFLFSPK
jgi:hypothetical protein